MASTSIPSENENVVDNLCKLGSLILKEEQKSAVEVLLSLKDVMVVLPTGSRNPYFFKASYSSKILAMHSS